MDEDLKFINAGLNKKGFPIGKPFKNISLVLKRLIVHV